MQKTIVFNTLGGPGSGKSTLSYGLIAYLKSRHFKAEFVPEYAKELSFQRDWNTLSDQGIVTREQDRRLRSLLGHVDFIIHDTALPLGIMYAQGDFAQEWFANRCWQLFDGYTNFNCFVTRKKAYQQYGRHQTEAEAITLDGRIRDLFADRIHLEIPGEEGSVEIAFKALMKFAEGQSWTDGDPMGR